jgi:hypothetical protein
VAVGKDTVPELFIIESLDRDDEEHERFEGQRIRTMLSLSGKSCKYVYVRTEREFRKMVDEFNASNFRYLHLSCHGNRAGLFTTFDRLSFNTVGEILTPFIKGRRVFVSACAATNHELADVLLSDSGCFSLMGPSCDIAFSDAAILWATFYHLMFKENDSAMKRTVIERHGAAVAKLFEVQLELFTRKDDETVHTPLR